MSKQNKPKLKRYLCRERGKYLAFGENKKLIGQKRLVGEEAPTGMGNPGLNGVKFRSQDVITILDKNQDKVPCSFFETNNAVLQKFIENHKATKGGFIFNQPTPEEQAEAALEAERKKTLESFRQTYKDGNLGVIDENRKLDSLQKLAGQIGVETKDGNDKELSAKVLAKNIVALLEEPVAKVEAA